MTEAAGVIRPVRAPYTRVVGAVSAAHFMSHYYIIALAPLMPFVRDEYQVTYTQIGLTFAVFNIVTAAFQTPAGFLVDRLGARVLLICGLAIGAATFVTAGLVDSFWVMIVMFAIAGIGNTVYHPADYALLSQHVSSDRIGQAFSVHTFAGMLGSAVAPASLLLMESFWGWRGAFVGTGALGFAVALLLLLVRDGAVGRTSAAAKAKSDAPGDGWRLLLAPPILLNLAFFVLLAMISSGLYNYSVVALGALYGTPVTTANAALSGNLLFSAIGVLAGGLLFAAIDAGTLHACGLTPAGAAYCWGDNSTGNLGTGSVAQSVTPIAVSGGQLFIRIVAGNARTCALTSGGVAWCWGQNTNVGTNSIVNSSTPVAVPGGLTFHALAGGDSHNCGLTAAGAAWRKSPSARCGSRRRAPSSGKGQERHPWSSSGSPATSRSCAMRSCST